MNRTEEWNAILENLFTNAEKNCLTERERTYQEQHDAEVEQMLNDHLCGDQRQMIDEVLYEFGTDAEQEARRLYRQGLRDGVWLLKNLGVLA